MYKSLDAYQKEKNFLIAIDSDGCVMDNMTVKHQQFFFPTLIKTLGVKDTDNRLAARWDAINLEYPLRGINRFKGLGALLETMPVKEDTTYYKQWLEETDAYKNESLEAWIQKTDDIFSKRVLEWSKTLNEKIKQDLKEVLPFTGAKEAIIKATDKADVVVMSSANHDAIVREWSEAGLLPYVRFVASQDVGTKEQCLKALCKKGYDTNKVLMIGDAISDYQAAKACGVHYHQITYQNEVASWQRFDREILSDFMKGTYAYMDDSILDIALKDALTVLKGNVPIYTNRFQHVSVEGVYPKEENKLWTMSFYPGSLYLAYHMTGDEAFLKHRKTILASFSERCDHGHMATHDIGFLFELTAAYDYCLFGETSSKALLLKAADKLMERYIESGGFIQAWGPMDEVSEDTRIIIDCMMNLPLLHMASALTNDERYKKAAISHAMLSSQTLVREDYSTYHTYYIHKETGKPVRGATHQGHKDESTWARGQAWSVYGFYKSYEWTKNPYFLNVAKECADVFLSNLPNNDICYWDFDFTDDNPDIRDSSAASIAVAGLLKMGQETSLENHQHYYDEGVRLLKILANRYQNNHWTQGCGILKEGMYHRNDGARAYTSWGDYYFVEALSTFFDKGILYEEM